ncbi:lysylphosphatidylglycerol synthase transmembrane domain-containing protein [Paracoccus sp. ME4]|uniref:lysylphosphatidylglycerol synthase transmembrane domain-containing protein n=1 Tax=Paracoccus sp. ME4 TaxID=3138066 RepID=UPI00398BBB03
MMTVTRPLQILVALGVMTLLWFGLDGRQALRLLAQADPFWLGAAMLALTVQTVLSALRWRVTARQLDQSIPMTRAIGEYYLAQVVNQSLPGGVLGDAGRAVRARHQAGLRRAGAAVAIERLAGQVSLFLVLAVGALTVTVMPGGLTLPTWVMGLIGTLMAGAVALIVVLAGVGQLGGRAGGMVRDLRRALRVTLLAPGALPRQLALNLSITVVNLAAFAFCARATGTVLSPSEAAVLVPLILLTMILPLTVSGWGLREGAAAALFPLVGASAQAGLAASLAFGLVFLASSLPGVLVLLAQRRGTAPLPAPAPAATIQADP